jgi:hypothetical protein
MDTLGAQQKQLQSKTNYFHTIRRSFCVGHLQCSYTIGSIIFVMGKESFAIAMSGLDQLLFCSVLEVNLLPISHTYI